MVSWINATVYSYQINPTVYSIGVIKVIKIIPAVFDYEIVFLYFRLSGILESLFDTGHIANIIGATVEAWLVQILQIYIKYTC